MKKGITLLFAVTIVISILLNLNGCKKENPVGPSNSVNISGIYKVEFSYHFDCDYYSATISGNSQPHQIVQNGNNISIGDCEGTINENNVVQFEGCLISYGGTQKFTGTYNPELKIISGTFTGTTCESGPYGTGYYDGTVSNGLFTLLKTDTDIDSLPPTEPTVSQLSFNCTEGSFSVEGNLESGSINGGIEWLDDSTIIAYDFDSFPVVSVAQLGFYSEPATGSYSFNYLSSAQAYFIWMLNADIYDTTDIYTKTCMLDNGTLNITSLNGKNLTGTFHGSGSFYQNSQHTQLTNGIVNTVGFGPNKRSNNIPIEVREILKSISNKIKKGK